VSYFGTVLVLQHDLHTGGSNVILGSALVLGSALSYSIYLISSGELVRRVGAVRLVAYAMCVSSVACLIQFFVLRAPADLVTQVAPVYQLSLFNAVFCTVLPVFLTMVAVARISAPRPPRPDWWGRSRRSSWGPCCWMNPLPASSWPAPPWCWRACGCCRARSAEAFYTAPRHMNIQA
jgi:hypothetical protein